MRFYSAHGHRLVQMVTLLPAGASRTGLGVVLALHGSASDAAALADLMAPAMTAASVRQFAVVCVDGGDTYWHRHADGDDAVGMIVHEVLPRAFDRLATLTGRQVPGGILAVCHDDAFWAANMPAALRFIAGHLG